MSVPIRVNQVAIPALPLLVFLCFLASNDIFFLHGIYKLFGGTYWIRRSSNSDSSYCMIRVPINIYTREQHFIDLCGNCHVVFTWKRNFPLRVTSRVENRLHRSMQKRTLHRPNVGLSCLRWFCRCWIYADKVELRCKSRPMKCCIYILSAKSSVQRLPGECDHA
jgi:hypothetical protein